MPRQVGADGTYNDYGIALATKLQLQLRQPMTDITTLLCNEDFVGDFFKIGDTVKIVKPSVDTISITDGEKNCDRPALSELDFTSTTMQIDRAMKYGFQVCDIQEVEGSWNYVSAATDIAGQKMRIAHNIRTAELILNNADVQARSAALGLGSPANPIVLDKDTMYENVLTVAKLALMEAGAVSADGRYTFGSNPEQPKRTNASIFLPTKAYGKLINLPQVIDKSTNAGDEAVRTGGFKDIMGLAIEYEPALDPTAAQHVTVNNLAAGAFCILVGTADTVTRAGKVLKPDSFRDHEKYADNYYGLEIYGEKVVSPNSVVAIFATVR